MIESALRSSVVDVRIRSNWLPEIVVDRPFAEKPPKPPGPPGAEGKAKFSPIRYLGNLARPQITVRTTYSSQPIIYAPFGAPGSKPRHKELIAGGAVIGGLALYGAYHLIKLALR